MTGASLDDAASRQRPWIRFVVFGVIVVLVAATLGYRLYTMQVANGDQYANLARDNRLALQPIRSTRGLVYDRHGVQLVENIPTFTVTVRPAELPFSQRGDVVARLAGLLEMPEVDIIETIDRAAGARFEKVRIATDVPTEVARIIAEQHIQLPGVEVAAEARREYPLGAAVSHWLGYTGAVSREDLEAREGQGYLVDDIIGRAGVEASLEETLRGQYGIEQVERDAQGRTVRVLRTLREAEPGASLELTLDVDVQADAERAMRWAMDIGGFLRGVVVVMNPQTGEILAMVSLPTYDNNLFAQGISSEDYRALLKDKARPLMNFAINEQYPPGSTFKLITGTGALADRLITPSTILQTRAYLSIGSYRYYDWNRAGFGPLDIYGGFAHSSDTFFYQVADMLGADRLAYWANQFGLGARTGIDLPNEAAGLIPTNEWKQSVFNQPILPGEVYHMGIGQGYVTTTPLQMLNSFATRANGGRLYKPQVVRRVLSADGTVVEDFEPELIRELPLDPEVLSVMRVAARRVLTSGHTYDLVRLPIVFGGKTGTAEFGVRERGQLPTHSWFAAFVPKFGPGEPGDVTKTDSELAVIAFTYDSKTRANAATEVVKYFLQLHYDLKIDLRHRWMVTSDYGYGN